MLSPVRGPGTRRTRVRRNWRTRLVRRIRYSASSWFIGLVVLTVAISLGVYAEPEWVPVTAFIVPTLIGGLVLSVRWFAWLLAIVTACLVVSVVPFDSPPARRGAVAVVLLVGLVMLWNARTRSRLGVAGSRGESMLIDLRDRLVSQGTLPDLPRPWYAEAVIRSAGGVSFSGDFLVATKTHDGRVLEVAVVDVSGKGIAAGTRALQLSGAFGGLLGALAPGDFLVAANDYLLRQEWGEGFATAVHLALDLETASFQVRTAGHPPAVQFHAGSGRWTVLSSAGPILGIMSRADFAPSTGQLQSGDALMLYTDGLVETPQKDITMGIDKLVGEAERLVAKGFERGASRLVDRLASEGDDRALLLLHRR